jgi:nickel transport protein
MEGLSHEYPIMRGLPSLVLSALLLSALMPSWVLAHNVGVACKLRGDKVEVEAFYDDDTPAQKAKVQVKDGKDEIIASGVTDEKGNWNFAAPTPGKYVVHLDAGAGHRARADLVVPAQNESATPDETISEGPTRAEFTSAPWLKVAIGLIVIGGLCGAFLIASMMRKNGQAKE